MKDSGHRDFTIRTFPGADHRLRVKAASGEREEAPDYFEVTRDWVRSRTGIQ
ncbi:MAG TPA: hypothetical protein VKU01_15225 [Bryobacteraceae bacterium]|nr:hypothetical protein [Bryobacteraceae bacterium]